MAWFKIYAGMGGSFGGAIYHGTYEYNDAQEASLEAYSLAVEDYEGYAGYYGVLSRENCREDIIESFGYEPTDEEVEDRYQEEIESWIEYYARPATSEHDIDDK